jgi:hypothetical protein
LLVVVSEQRVGMAVRDVDQVRPAIGRDNDAGIGAIRPLHIGTDEPVAGDRVFPRVYSQRCARGSDAQLPVEPAAEGVPIGIEDVQLQIVRKVESQKPKRQCSLSLLYHLLESVEADSNRIFQLGIAHDVEKLDGWVDVFRTLIVRPICGRSVGAVRDGGRFGDTGSTRLAGPSA